MAATTGKSKIMHAVLCLRHGRERKAPYLKMLQVGAPKGKNQRRFGGCPLCKQEARS